MGPKVQTLEEITSEETEHLGYIVAMVKRCQQPREKSSILMHKRRKQIREIVNHLRGKGTQRVSFSTTVVCHKLVAPQLIYHALFPKEIELKEVFDPPIRSCLITCVCGGVTFVPPTTVPPTFVPLDKCPPDI